MRLDRPRLAFSGPSAISARWLAAGLCCVGLALGLNARAQRAVEAPEFNDGHFHLTNYVQEGIDLRTYLGIMGTRVGRSTLFGLPLQQQWSHRVSGDFAPTYYLESDAHLYYYSFTDAFIAMQYLRLPEEHRARFDPMITGFNPTDMYGVDHIRRVLQTFPGVFVGIGEFTIHKEFVSGKVAGDVASLTDPALDRILQFAGEVGLVVLLHNDVSMPFSEAGAGSVYVTRLQELFRRHPKTTIIWAHVGLGRVIQPIERHAAFLERMVADPAYRHVYFDISWSEVAKYVVDSPESIEISADLFNRYSDRFLFGTDTVAPKNAAQHGEVYEQYAALWRALSPKASANVRLGNYERLFDEARRRVRAWEKKNVTTARREQR